MASCRFITFRIILVLVPMIFMFLLGAGAGLVSARNTVEVPVLAAIRANDRGVFSVMVMDWDKQSAPDPMEVRWGNSRIRVKEAGMGALATAFTYAIDRTTQIRPTGTLTLYGASYAPASSDGRSAGAVLAVGFLAVLRGDGLIRGVALTGTLQPDGRIGPVGGLPDKIRAAAREGYRTVLGSPGPDQRPSLEPARARHGTEYRGEGSGNDRRSVRADDGQNVLKQPRGARSA
jgi:PDZ domain-containing protein